MGESVAIVQVTTVMEFFRESFCAVARKQKLKIHESTEAYLVNLLSRFTRAEAIFERAPNGAYRAPLMTELLTAALEAPTDRERIAQLRRLGDVALFTASFFAHGFARKILDVDYYINMGGRAFGALADNRAPSLAALRPIFGELAAKFVPVVDALSELANTARPAKADDLLRHYEIWLKTGSARAYDQLVAAGIQPLPGRANGSRQ